MAVGGRYWRWRHHRWPAALPQSPGYTLLLPVPGDLPVFLTLALKVCGSQQSAGRVSTVVIPDHVTPAVSQIVDEARASWAGDLVLRPLPRPERWVLPRIKTGGGWRNHWIQLVTGVTAARGTHVILHDADLILVRPDALDAHYAACRDMSLACLGVEEAWDPWFAERGLRVAATWEMCARVDWLRSFPPYFHLAGGAEILGEFHGCDLTFHAQALSSGSVGISPMDGAFVHFNNVIGTYRRFQRQGAGFEDSWFRLLLIRLFIDVLGGDGPEYALPSAEELARGLDRAGPVAYPSPDAGREEYEAFRAKVRGALAEPWLDGDLAGRILAPFDAYYGAVA